MEIEYRDFSDESIQDKLVTEVFIWRAKQLGFGISNVIDFFNSVFMKYLSFKVEIFDYDFVGNSFSMTVNINGADKNLELIYHFKNL